jgi:trk system potassium uptake protein TrkH
MAFIISGCMTIPFIIEAVLRGQDRYAFALSLAVGFGVGALLYLAGGKSDMSRMSSREALMSVAMSWVVASLISAFPYLLSGAAPTYTDAFFESMSGYTTTGSTIFPALDALPHGLLTWRAITHWLGGMGIIALTLAMLPHSGAGGFQMFSAESPGMTHEKITPRLRQTAVLLWLIYAFLTASLTVLLMLGGMTFFDAANHSMATISTGGFSTHSSSLAFFGEPYFEWVITIFMFLSGANFALHFQALKGRSASHFLTDPEFRFYAISVSAITLLVSFSLYIGDIYGSFLESLRFGAFQAVSFITSTGFVSANYEVWPHFAKALLFICLFLGGCSGSTAGGIKHARLLVMGGHLGRQLGRTLNPRSVAAFPMGSRSIDPSVMSSCMAFFGLYLTTFAAGAFAATLFEGDLITALSAAASSLGNVGPAFVRLGPEYNFSGQATGAKWVYSFLMLCGRLELYTVLSLFTGTFWREGIICGWERD